ncbi:MAG: GyrI-like domain-containing protein [Anaerolineales bacterium]|jgi:predicted transcriptional regulator YdeE
MKPQIIQREQMTFLGLEYYGPLSGEGWSAGNAVGQLWQRYGVIWDKRKDVVEGKVIKPEFGYELMIWNENEFQDTKNFYIFVGAEIDPGQLTDLPLEMVVRVLPASTYASFTVKGENITKWEDKFYKEWLPVSGYQLAYFNDYNLQIQAYEAGRFKGLGDLIEQSEVDVLIPIEKTS